LRQALPKTPKHAAQLRCLTALCLSHCRIDPSSSQRHSMQAASLLGQCRLAARRPVTASRSGNSSPMAVAGHRAIASRVQCAPPQALPRQLAAAGGSTLVRRAGRCQREAQLSALLLVAIAYLHHLNNPPAGAGAEAEHSGSAPAAAAPAAAGGGGRLRRRPCRGGSSGRAALRRLCWRPEDHLLRLPLVRGG
jgi:hypothetical protein